MKNISNQVVGGFTIGILWNAYFIWRYLIKYEDISQCLLFCLVGLGLMTFSFVYHLYLREQNARTEDIDELKSTITHIDELMSEPPEAK